MKKFTLSAVSKFFISDRLREGAARLQDALERLTAAIRDVESELAAMKAERDPLAAHIFVSRRHYRNVTDTKSGKRREMMARLSFNTACELGFRGSPDAFRSHDGRQENEIVEKRELVAS